MNKITRQKRLHDLFGQILRMRELGLAQDRAVMVEAERSVERAEQVCGEAEAQAWTEPLQTAAQAREWAQYMDALERRRLEAAARQDAAQEQVKRSVAAAVAAYQDEQSWAAHVRTLTGREQVARGRSELRESDELAGRKPPTVT